MAFNPNYQWYDPTQEQFDFSRWLNPQQSQQDTNYAYSGGGGSTTPGTIGDGTIATPNPQPPRYPGNNMTDPNYGGAPATGGYPNYPTTPGMIGDGTIPQAPSTPNTGRNQSPSGLPGDTYLGPAPAPTNGMPPYGGPVYPGGGTSPAPGGGASAPGASSATQAGLVATGNPGNDRSRPPDNSGDWFWSGTAGHWVDSTGKRDATGRVLSDTERPWWQGYDQRRASGTNDAQDYMMMKYGNTTLPTGVTQPGMTATQSVVQQATAAGTAGGPAAQSAGVNYDPTFETQVRTMLEDPKGPYANRKPGDYGPIGSPDFVLNPQTQQQWVDRYNWFLAHPEAFTTGYTQPRDLSAAQYDFTKPNSVPYTVFLQNAYADTNARQGFTELSGTLTPQQLAQVQQQRGWGDAVSGLNADANLVYRTMYQMAAADPSTDYNVVKVLQPDGSIGYGLQKRSQAYTGAAPVVNTGGGGGGPVRNVPVSRPVASLPRPAAAAPVAPPPNPLTVPGQIPGEVKNVNGDNYQWTGSAWVRYNYNTINPRPIGGPTPKMG